MLLIDKLNAKARITKLLLTTSFGEMKSLSILRVNVILYSKVQIPTRQTYPTT